MYNTNTPSPFCLVAPPRLHQGGGGVFALLRFIALSSTPGVSTRLPTVLPPIVLPSPCVALLSDLMSPGADQHRLRVGACPDVSRPALRVCLTAAILGVTSVPDRCDESPLCGATTEIIASPLCGCLALVVDGCVTASLCVNEMQMSPTCSW